MFQSFPALVSPPARRYLYVAVVVAAVLYIGLTIQADGANNFLSTSSLGGAGSQAEPKDALRDSIPMERRATEAHRAALRSAL